MVLRVLPPQGSLSVMTNMQDLALLSTCHQIYHEAAPLLYKLAELRLLDLQSISSFFKLMNPEYRPAVASLAMWWPDFERTGATIKYLYSQPFPNVQELVIRGTPKKLLNSASHNHVFHGKGRKISLVFLA